MNYAEEADGLLNADPGLAHPSPNSKRVAIAQEKTHVYT